MGQFWNRSLLAALCVGLWFATRSAQAQETEAPPSSEAATHEQVGVISPLEGQSGNLRLAGFSLNQQGQIVALLGAGQAEPHAIGAAPAAKGEGPPALVRVLDADGTTVAEWPVDFAAQAVNVRPNGEIVLGGDGYLARYDAQGKQLAKAEAPHIVATRQDPEALDRQAREMVESQRNSIKDVIQQFEQQQKDLEKKSDEELTDEERELKPQIEQILTSYRQLAKQQGDQGAPQEAEIEQMKQMIVGQQRTINAIAADEQHVYVTCRSAKGFGYSVWRTDAEFANPSQTIDGLKGCCGQMDVQCCSGELIVSENARHRVVRYDAEGKEVDSWGKRSRDGVGEDFGGCCNPMNSRLVGGDLYVAESDGKVKRFSPSGEYLGLVGVARVQPGCKSSIIDVSKDGQYVYYFDVQNSSICQLKRKPTVDKQASR